MSFEQQVLLTVLDKALIGGLLLLAGFVLNKALERVKHDLGLEAARRQLTGQSQIEFRERQLAELYGPVYALLKQIRSLDDIWEEARLTKSRVSTST